MKNQLHLAYQLKQTPTYLDENQERGSMKKIVIQYLKQMIHQEVIFEKDKKIFTQVTIVKFKFIAPLII